MNIYQRMLKISEEAESIPKNGWNDYSKYKYVRAVDLIGHIKKLLVKHGVHLDIEETNIERTLHGKNFHSEIHCEGVFTNVEDPKEQIRVPYYSVSADTLDKDIFKAKTNGLKYLLSQTFKVVTDDFIDTETSGKETDDQNLSYITEEQEATITALASEVDADYDKFLKYLKIKDTSEILAKDYDRVIKILEKKRGDN